MSRPPVSVVMPFAGDAAAAVEALAALRALRLAPGDELILSDNTGAVPATAGVSIVRARGERSPAHARNAGAAQARGEWILFIDADCRAPADLLDRYFAASVADDVGALAGEVTAAPVTGGLAGRYGASRNFLNQSAHLAHPFRPRAAAANLLVRRVAFVALGGFVEGVRAAEDTDFSWRLQEAGWRLELAPGAAVEHRYRASVRELRRQWRSYAAGRAWLARRYPGFVPEPAVRRAVHRGVALLSRRPVAARAAASPAALPPGPPAHDANPPASGPPGATPLAPLARLPAPPGRLQRAGFLALDALLGAEELAGLALSNRPGSAAAPADAQAVLIAEHFPAAGDPLVELAQAIEGVRVEASARPRHADLRAAHNLPITYREDDGAGQRLRAAAALVLRHPLRSVSDVLARGPGEPSLLALAPAALRIEHDSSVRLLALGTEPARLVAARLARLTGRALDSAAPGAR